MKKYITVLIMFILLIGGVWLLGQPGKLAPETLARIQALSSYSNGGAGNTAVVVRDTPETFPLEPVEGSIIDLSQLVPDEDDGGDLYSQWLNGEIDLEQEGSFITPAQEAVLRETHADKGPNENIQDPANALENIDFEVSFPGPDIRDCCPTTNQGTVPPDPELAVGPDHLVAVVNSSLEIYSKSGQVLVNNITLSSFFGSINGCNSFSKVFDPNALYDESANRFFIGTASKDGYYCTAVSATANPAGSWIRYRFYVGSGGGFFDYPHAGIGREAIYMGANIFDCQGCSYREARIWAFNKAAMYAGLPAAAIERVVPEGQTRSTPQPANLHGFAQGTWPISGPHYYIVDANFNGSTYSVYAWTAPFGANNFSATGIYNLTTATGVSPIFPFASASQLGSGQRLATNDWRSQDNEYRNGFLWTTSTITCNPGGGVVTCVRWAQINPVNGTIVQAGVVGSSGQYRIFGDLATNHCSDMALGYSKTSSNSYPGIWVAARQGTDPANTIQGETLMKAGETSYGSFDKPPYRWGDYTGFTSDPNGRDFWYLGQYSKNVSHPSSNWGTYIGCYAATACTAPNGTNGGSAQKAGDTPPTNPELLSNFNFLPVIVRAPMLPCGY